MDVTACIFKGCPRSFKASLNKGDSTGAAACPTADESNEGRGCDEGLFGDIDLLAKEGLSGDTVRTQAGIADVVPTPGPALLLKEDPRAGGTLDEALALSVEFR